jgi:hypothetical protein
MLFLTSSSQIARSKDDFFELFDIGIAHHATLINLLMIFFFCSLIQFEIDESNLLYVAALKVEWHMCFTNVLLLIVWVDIFEFVFDCLCGKFNQSNQ